MPSDSKHRPAREQFRRCVACLLQHADGRILVCERVDFAGSWQFPQGGQDPGETPRESLTRELMEEISIPPESFHILEEKSGYLYRFPQRHRRRGRFAGQQQIYFLCRFDGPDSLINLATAHPEFRSWKWVEPAEFELDWLPDFKRGVYAAVLEDFFGLSFPAEDTAGARFDARHGKSPG